jgi:hypothetical protein
MKYFIIVREVKIVGIVMGYGLDGQGTFLIPNRGKMFPPLRSIQTGCEAHRALYSVGIRGKATGL